MVINVIIIVLLFVHIVSVVLVIVFFIRDKFDTSASAGSGTKELHETLQVVNGEGGGYAFAIVADGLYTLEF
ncbi:hypothetical protein ACG7TL_000495 [Trametes sanguinea]